MSILKRRRFIYTESRIQDILSRDLISKNHQLITPNVFLYSWESDLISITNADFSHEYEIKISKSDFKQDTKKNKHKWLQKGRNCSNYFWYCCPHDLIDSKDIPEYAGLIYIQNDYIRVIKPAPRLHTNKITDRHHNYLSRGLMLRYWSQRRQNNV